MNAPLMSLQFALIWIQPIAWLQAVQLGITINNDFHYQLLVIVFIISILLSGANGAFTGNIMDYFCCWSKGEERIRYGSD